MSAASVIISRASALFVAAALCLLLAAGTALSLAAEAATPDYLLAEQLNQITEATEQQPDPAAAETAAPGDQPAEQPAQETQETETRSDAAGDTPVAAPGDLPVEQPDQATEEVETWPDADGDELAATSGISEMNVVSIINADEQGRGLFMPYFVFCDRPNNEVYIVDRGFITVYADNFFPVASIGKGRELITASGVYVDQEGNVYVTQGMYYNQPPRITVYNAAFFPVRHIDLSSIPEAEAGHPRSLVIGDNGNIYVAFDDGLRGLLVLDREGRFSHWLEPMDLIAEGQAIEEAKAAKELEEEEPETRKQPDFDVSELVPELVPRQGEQFSGGSEPELKMGPVQINDIQRDENGNLYLLSIETGKVYIYNSDEEYLYSFGEKGGSTGQLSQPRQLVVDSKKKAIYIVDYMRHAILIYDLSGRFMHEFGGKGNRPGWFQYPTSITTNSRGELVVADMFNRRVQVLDVQFEYRFPLFQVPFVYHQVEKQQPQPMQASSGRFYGPGFDAGDQASAGGDREEIRALLEDDDAMI